MFRYFAAYSIELVKYSWGANLTFYFINDYCMFLIKLVDLSFPKPYEKLELLDQHLQMAIHSCKYSTL